MPKQHRLLGWGWGLAAADPPGLDGGKGSGRGSGKGPSRVQQEQELAL